LRSRWRNGAGSGNVLAGRLLQQESIDCDITLLRPETLPKSKRFETAEDALMQKAPTRTDSVDLNEAVREVLELTHGEALGHGVSVRTQLADGLPLIQGDRVQLQQVVLNLILNAVQAMGVVADGTREVLITSSQTEPNEVCLGVQDSGPGLSAETLPRLFEPFYTTKPGGMGMGLAICRSIIEAHGGRLWAAGCEPRGALFQFTIHTD
jgi:signal transduction histidine kinase